MARATGSRSGKRPHQHQIVESESGRRYERAPRGSREPWIEVPADHVCGCHKPRSSCGCDACKRGRGRKRG